MRGTKICEAAGELRKTFRYTIAYNFDKKSGYFRLDGKRFQPWIPCYIRLFSVWGMYIRLLSPRITSHSRAGPDRGRHAGRRASGCRGRRMAACRGNRAVLREPVCAQRAQHSLARTDHPARRTRIHRRLGAAGRRCVVVG